MKFKFPIKVQSPVNLIRHCGYGQIYDPKMDQISFARKLGGANYPRFHVYLDVYDDYFVVNLHLDQKKASYEGTTAHSGEYDGPIIEDEARRITSIIAQVYGY